MQNDDLLRLQSIKCSQIKDTLVYSKGESMIRSTGSFVPSFDRNVAKNDVPRFHVFLTRIISISISKKLGSGERKVVISKGSPNI